MGGTSLIAIRANIAIGDVKGTKERTFINTLSTLPPTMEKIVAIKEATKSITTGITSVLVSSIRLARDASAPNRNA